MAEIRIDQSSDLAHSSGAWFDQAKTNGWFTDYDTKTAFGYVADQAEDQSGQSGGGIRSVQFVHHRDRDPTDYTTVGQKISYAQEWVVSGAYSSGSFQAQYKDLVGGSFTAIGRIEWDARGVSGILANAIQYGSGIASNEFVASNPAAAVNQSSSMAAVQAIISGKKAAADASHLAHGVRVTNLGKQATAAFAAHSAGTDGDNGHFAYLLDGSQATASAAGIVMPQGDVGSIIEYDTNDWTDFIRSTNIYRWIVGGSVEAKIGSGLVVGNPTGGAKGLGTINCETLYVNGVAVT